MKVKLFTEGGKSIGLGHISRCMSLFDEVSRRNIPVDFIVNGNVKDVDFLKGINIINVNWLNQKYLTNNISSDDYVIIDSYKAEREIYNIIANISKKSMFIDDIGRLDYPEGIIVNPSLDASHIEYSQSTNRVLLFGPEYVIVRTPFVGVKREDAFDRINRILITMGGSDTKELTPLLIENICKNRLDIAFDIVMGSVELEEHNVNRSGNTNITIHNNIDANHMMELMVNCDLAITAAGQTIYELLATHTPFIPIQIIENQENNIRSLLEYNPNQVIFRCDDGNLFDHILSNIDLNNNADYREEQNNKYKGLVDGYGSKRIIDKLL